MEKFSVEEVIKVTHGRLTRQGKDPWIRNVRIDSRKVMPGDLYIPIVGANNDGHRFIGSAVQNGAAAVLADTDHQDVPAGDFSVIEVEDTLEALKQMAGANRARYDIPVIVVTGSSGKTTTKDVVTAVLSQKFNTMKTQGNFNNEYGIPQTLFQMGADTEAAVIEMGMNHMGEIARSIWEVRPHIGIITNIGSAHLENMKTKDNTLLSKKQIFSLMGPEDFALLNGDDPYLQKIKDETYQIVRVGLEADNLDLKAVNVKTGKDGIAFEVDGEAFHFNYPGIHNVYNCLMAIWIGRCYGMDRDAIQRGLDAFVPSGSRMKPVDVAGCRFIDDSYNANPESMKAALNTVADWNDGKGRVIAVLGDMLEIGDGTEKRHFETGCYAAAKADGVVAVGELSRHLAAGARTGLPAEKVWHADDAAGAGKILTEILESGDTVLIKASHGMELHRAVDVFQEDRA